jgi:hypothetical protein
MGVLLAGAMFPHSRPRRQPAGQGGENAFHRLLEGMAKHALEHWQVDAGDADIATLDIPPALRVRRFHVDVRFVVARPAEAAEAWHAMSVELNGRRQWSRQIPTSNPGQTDSLDYHVRVDVPEGDALRVRASTKVKGAVRRQLRIEAEEQ